MRRYNKTGNIVKITNCTKLRIQICKSKIKKRNTFLLLGTYYYYYLLNIIKQKSFDSLNIAVTEIDSRILLILKFVYIDYIDTSEENIKKRLSQCKKSYNINVVIKTYANI